MNNSIINKTTKINRVRHIIEIYDMHTNHFPKLYARFLLKSLSDEQIINEVGMDQMPYLIYLLSLKYNLNPRLTSIYDGKDVMISFPGINVANVSYLALYLHFFRFENGKLILEGTTSFPSIISFEKFFVKINDKYQNIVLNDIGEDIYIGNNLVELRKGFKIEFPIRDELNISFYNELIGNKVRYGKINSMRFAPISDVISNQYYYKDGYVFYIKGASIICKNLNGHKIEDYELKYQNVIKKQYPQKYLWVKELRDYAINYKKDNNYKILLFMDRPDCADDNAKVLFKYVQNKPNIRSYFLLEKKSRDYDEMSKIGNIVEIYSNEHYKLALIADYIISSQCNGLIENPFWSDSEFFRDLYHQGRIVFLQHGIIKDDMSLTLNRFNTNFYGFITSTEDEYQSIINYPYFYSKNEVWLTGLPRYDELYNSAEKLILIMPTWRKNIMHQEWVNDDMQWILNTDYIKSSFFKKYVSLLTNKALLNECEANGYRILMRTHPLMKNLFKNIDLNNHIISIDEGTSYKELFAKASLLITDYSSVAFDFAFLNKPVLYYQFDHEEFFSKHTYRKGYFDYELDGVGAVVFKEKDLINKVVYYMNNDCIVEEKFRDKVNLLYKYKDHFCERVYKKIME